MKKYEYFKDKYKSLIIQNHLIDLIEKMTELKRLNYYDMSTIERRNNEIKEIEQALTELNIPFEKYFEILNDLTQDDYE